MNVNARKAFMQSEGRFDIDFSDVKGQSDIKRALEIAAAGGHNAVLIGPPGAGKTMLAKRSAYYSSTFILKRSVGDHKDPFCCR